MKMLLLTISLLLFLGISRLLQVAVGRLWIVVPMIIYLYTTVIMGVQECLVSNSRSFHRNFPSKIVDYVCCLYAFSMI